MCMTVIRNTNHQLVRTVANEKDLFRSPSHRCAMAPIKFVSFTNFNKFFVIIPGLDKLCHHIFWLLLENFDGRIGSLSWFD